MTKRLIKAITSCFLALILTLSANVGCINIEYKELGIPLKERFPKGIYARTAWDMVVWENKLYIGSGDYDSNMGPTDIWYYDLTSKTWTNSGRVNDEQVMRFCIIGGKLCAPGIDPKNVRWDIEEEYYGNYYQLDGGAWKTFEVLPNTIHNFDIVENDGKIFAGLGIKEGSKAVAISADGGKTFSLVDFIKENKSIDTAESTSIRVYELFVHNGETFALLRYGKDRGHYELYRYDGNNFKFHSDWTGRFYGSQPTFNLFAGKVSFKGKTYFSIGNLFKTQDMDRLNYVHVEDNVVICDMIVKNGTFYVLGAKKTEVGYKISVWENKTGEDKDFVKLFTFNYDMPALSFESDGEYFYFGIGSRSVVHEKNGMVLSIKYPINENVGQ